jgi:hypothetical protein
MNFKRWLVQGLVAALPLFAHATDFTPSETLATTYRWFLDPEFNLTKNLVTWVDASNGDIWVSGLDPTTGNLVPADGKGKLIEAGAAPIGGLGFTLNGPEWALGSNIDYVVYTRFEANKPKTAEYALIGIAARDQTGTWTHKNMSPAQRNAPFGSRSRNSSAKISYNDADGNHYWRSLNDASTEEALPLLAGSGLTPAVRFSDTENVVAYPAFVPGTNQTQVFSYNLDTHTLSQMTTDGGNKDQPWIWTAPDYGQTMMLTIVDKSAIGLYAQQYGQWVQIQKLDTPVPGTWFSTEPFTYKGKSYALAQLTRAGQNYPSSIWLIGFDPVHPLLRQLTPDQPDRARADPEIVFTSSGPIVYFSRFDQTKGSYWLCLPCMEGAFRTPTGLE